MLKRLISGLLCLLVVLSIPVTVLAEAPEETQPVQTVAIEIKTREEFLAFAENCRLDSYSRNLEVTLKANIDLTGVDFQGIPIFCGSFDGNGYSITGLNITGSGSVLGLFRYLTETAEVKDLTAAGDIQPQGSRSTVGGIAGSNAGRIENCSFSGTVSGGDRIGGLAGTNEVTGILAGCSVSGSVYGNHFVGGIAGENSGVIRKCKNSAQINTTAQQNSVDISDITIETLTGSEAANTVTDIGGIAGSSSGVIRSCMNWADVGYQHMGYNIGGIAGSQAGYITDCENYGAISGRKEVGGIVGHMEPAMQMIYSEDTLQILQEQLDTMGTLTNRASANAQYGASSLSSQVAQIQEQTETAMSAIEALLPDEQEPELPDADAILAAQNALSSSMSNIEGSLRSISATAQNTAGALSGDLQAISDQASTMSETINGAAETLGGSITDISDADTAEDLTGKVQSCINFGAVLADRNVGGIAGAMALENDLDPEDDVQITGELSLNFDSELRAVILDCENEGTVTVTKQNGGGIAGWMAMGLVKESSNSGALDGGNADHIGGIAGQSLGYIRSASAKCQITGDSHVGGIAGSGDIVSDCRSMVQLTGAERVGAVLGLAESREEITGNFYLAVEEDPGAIDGISYEGSAQSMEMEEFLALQGLPKLFKTVVVQFLFEDGTVDTVYVPTGKSLRKEEIPEIPEKAGYTACWDGLTDLYPSFDTVYAVSYTPLASVLQSEAQKNGLPVLLAEGVFGAEAAIAVADPGATPVLEKKQILADTLGVSLPAEVSEATVRYLLPEELDTERLQLLLRAEDGNWQEIPYRVDGSYLVFAVSGGVHTLALVQTRNDLWQWIAIAAAGAALIAGTTVIVVRAAKKKAK